jgi:hypothetical protein
MLSENKKKNILQGDQLSSKVLSVGWLCLFLVVGDCHSYRMGGWING